MRNFARNNIGKTFGRITILSVFKNGRHFGALVDCICGQTKKINYIQHILQGDVRSCGCLLSESVSQRRTSHGMTNTPIHRVWISMSNRCNNENYRMYHRYGGRGISVCDEWSKDFMTFYRWAIENGHRKGLSLDRINNDGNYEPTNCRWATPKEQARNRGDNVLLTHNNETRCLSDWAEAIGVNDFVILYRYKRGLPIDRILYPGLLNINSSSNKNKKI